MNPETNEVPQSPSEIESSSTVSSWSEDETPTISDEEFIVSDSEMEEAEQAESEEDYGCRIVAIFNKSNFIFNTLYFCSVKTNYIQYFTFLFSKPKLYSILHILFSKPKLYSVFHIFVP